MSFLLRNQQFCRLSKQVLAACAIILVLCTGVSLGVSIALGQSFWEDRHWQGGFAANFESKSMKWWPALGVVSAVLANSLADLVLVRTYSLLSCSFADLKRFSAAVSLLYHLGK